MEVLKILTHNSTYELAAFMFMWVKYPSNLTTNLHICVCVYILTVTVYWTRCLYDNVFVIHVLESICIKINFSLAIIL